MKTLPKHNEYLDEDFNEQIVFQDLKQTVSRLAKLQFSSY